mgnify:CR=1 FL=1
MLRKQVKKYGLALGLGISMLLLAGCEKKSVDDLYNMTESTSKEEMQTSKNGTLIQHRTGMCIMKRILIGIPVRNRN